MTVILLTLLVVLWLGAISREVYKIGRGVSRLKATLQVRS